MDRKKLLSMAQNDDDRILISKIYDMFLFSESKNVRKNSQFLNGHEICVAKNVAACFGLCYDFFGGYDEAERRIMVCYPEFLRPEACDIPIKVIKAETKNKKRLSHRDYMGAVLNLGIRREKVGDIVVCDGFGYIVCMEDIAEYIALQVEKIGSCGVNISVSSFDSADIPPKQFKEIEASLSSVRLDTVVGAGFGISRAEAADLVVRELVSVNWETKKKNDFRPQDGDIISVHGHGRIMLYKIGGTSKKGRIFVTIRKFV